MVEFYTRPLAVVGISALSFSIWARHPTEWTVSGVLVELAGPIPQRISPVRNQGIGGAPGGTRTPDLLVRSHKSKNANCPIWRRLRTGNAILPSISCTQSCTQNRIISNLPPNEYNPKSRVRPCRYSEPCHHSERLSLHHLCSSLLRSSL